MPYVFEAGSLNLSSCIGRVTVALKLRCVCWLVFCSGDETSEVKVRDVNLESVSLMRRSDLEIGRACAIRELDCSSGRGFLIFP